VPARPRPDPAAEEREVSVRHAVAGAGFIEDISVV